MPDDVTPAAGDAEPGAEPRPIRALVVDYEAHNRLHVQDRLRHEADVAVVGTAADGVEAVEAIRALAPDGGAARIAACDTAHAVPITGCRPRARTRARPGGSPAGATANCR